MMLSFTSPLPLSLYVHIPWCVKKCPYCDFNSHVSNQGLPEKAYIDALTADLEQELPEIWGRSISSIFIGGGTPSLFSAESIEQLLSRIRARLNLIPAIEITLEANPGTLEKNKFAEFRAAGINRLSIGVQSFQAELLQRIGRIHDAKQAYAACETALACGFDSVNLDLMYGLPGQTIRQAQEDIQTAISLAPPHISQYQLTIEPETAFYKQPPQLPLDDKLSYMQTLSQDQLAAAGYVHYEISAYAKPGQECIHNLNYWMFGDYIGIGAGAHGKITMAASNTVIRKHKPKNPRQYMAAYTSVESNSETESYQLNKNDLQTEFMMNALRLCNGFDSGLMLRHAGLPIGLLHAKLRQAEQLGLLDRQHDWIQPTAKGRRFLNDLICIFMD